MPRPTVRLTVSCDNACVFCAQRGLTGTDLSLDEIRAELSILREKGTAVTFIGGEPARAATGIDAVAAARALGFTGIGLQTNGGLPGASPSLLPDLTRAGLTDLHFSIHGAEPAIHDHHTGRPGSFTAALSAMSSARVLKVAIVVTTVLTRSNALVLWELPRLLKSAGVSGWLVSVVRVAGAIAPATDILSPRLGVAMPHALLALETAQRLGLPAWIQGAPLCLLGPFAARVLPETPSRTFGAPCGACPSRTRCPGVDAAYLERFQGDELVARETPAPPTPPPVTELFVGVGELAPSVVVVEEPPAVPPTSLTQLVTK